MAVLIKGYSEAQMVTKETDGERFDSTKEIQSTLCLFEARNPKV